MKDIDRLLKNIQSINIDSILYEIWGIGMVQDYIIELNTEGEATSQLYMLGEDSDGNKLGQYSNYTKIVKGSKGQKTDFITLKDTGDFYNTFRVIAKSKGFEIVANPVKDNDNLFDEFGENIVGLNKKNQELLIEFIMPLFLERLEKRILQ